MSGYGIRLAVNGSETDEDVEGDSADWLCKIGDIRTTEGGGSFLNEAAHAVASFTAQIPLNLVPLMRTLTIAIEGPHSSPPAWFHDNGDGTAYRIVFHGPITTTVGSVTPDGRVRMEATSEMQALYERRAHIAADTNTDPRTIAAAIETAHSITVGNNTMIPGSGDFFNIDAPEQRESSNGDHLRTAIAGTGMSIIGEWEGTLAAPTLCWRTDYQWFTGGNFRIIPAGRPWFYSYPDVGVSWKDFVARVEVNGEQGNTLAHRGYVRYPTTRKLGPRPATRIIDVSNGTRYWGSAALGDGGVRAQLGYTEASVATWIDTATECEDAAKWIARHVGEPTFLKMNRVGWFPDLVAADADADPAFDPDPDDYGMDHATILVGDQMSSRAVGAAFDDTNGVGGDNQYGVWPTSCPDSGPVYDDLESLWVPNVTSNGEVPVSNDYYFTVRTLNREWVPGAGWYIEVGLEPDNLIPAAGFNLDHGTYT